MSLRQYQVRGWFLKSNAIRLFLSKTPTGAIPCYVCSTSLTYDSIAYSRTIPYSTIPLEHRETTPSVYGICNTCASSGIPACMAPRNYKMVVDYYITKQSDIAASHSVIKELEEKRQSLQREISELANENKHLERNRELEIAKLAVLKTYETQSLDVVCSITARIDAMRATIRKAYLECAQEITDTHGSVQTSYNTLLSMISKEQKNISQLAETEVENTYMCNICCIRQIHKVLVPCGHLICELCHVKLSEESTTHIRCPFCKTASTTTLRVFV